jgi:hypothetical protein
MVMMLRQLQVVAIVVLAACCCSSRISIQKFRTLGLSEQLRAYRDMRAEDCVRDRLSYLYVISAHGCEAAAAVAPSIREPSSAFSTRDAMDVIDFASAGGCDVMAMPSVAPGVRWAAENATDPQIRADAQRVLARTRRTSG